MATVRLRLRGVTPLHAAAAAIAAVPGVFVLYQVVVRQARLSAPLMAAAVAASFLPWLSRAMARASYRARCDDIAVHVRGEALPYKTITEVLVDANVLRRTLRLKRGESIELQLVLWDAFAGRLEPLEELSRRLAAAGKPIPNG